LDLYIGLTGDALFLNRETEAKLADIFINGVLIINSDVPRS